MNENQRLGRYINCSVTGESWQVFLPPDLPPVPIVDIQGLQTLLGRAAQALGRLNAIASALPDRQLLLYYNVRKEAVLSSQIEGAQSSLSDLLLYESDEMPSTPIDDVVEASSCVAALEQGQQRIQRGIPAVLAPDPGDARHSAGQGTKQS